jgi:hypothetical protein
MELGQQGRQNVLTGARMALAQLSERLGAAGFEAMRSIPGLTAQVDQHLAQIRHTVGDPEGRVHPVSLAAYADGVADAATGKGWSAAETAEGWGRASCLLATEI